MPRSARAAAGLWIAGALVGASVSPTELTGQATLSVPRLWEPARSFTTLAPDPFTPLQSQASAPRIGTATLLSAVLPGAGQHVLGQKRKWIYLTLEALAWVGYTDRRSTGGAVKDEYRDFAWTEARVQASERVDGDFAYYETMTKWVRSGLFDTDPATPGVQPEVDPGTYNASIWSLASQLFLGAAGTPDAASLQRALSYYGERAYGSEFLWDWTSSEDGQDVYADLITESDDAYRQATNILGIIIANHVVSAIDAFVSARGLTRGAEIDVMPSYTPVGTRWHARVGVPTPW